MPFVCNNLHVIHVMDRSGNNLVGPLCHRCLSMIELLTSIASFKIYSTSLTEELACMMKEMSELKHLKPFDPICYVNNYRGL